METVTMKDLKVGDVIVGPNGERTEITDVYEEHIPERMYELTMANGETIKCSGNHLWYCESDSDRKGRKKYERLAKKYFKKRGVPKLRNDNPEFALELMIEFLGGSEWEDTFIQKACESLGPVSMIPQEYYEDDLFTPVARNVTYLYSYNDIVKSLERMNSVVTSKEKGYFYFGKVRTTDQIFSIIDENINIPEKGDLN